MKIRYVTLLAAIAGLMVACGNDRKAGMQPDPSLKEAASFRAGSFAEGSSFGQVSDGGSVECTSGSRSGYLRLESGKTSF